MYGRSQSVKDWNKRDDKGYFVAFTVEHRTNEGSLAFFKTRANTPMIAQIHAIVKMPNVLVKNVLPLFTKLNLN